MIEIRAAATPQVFTRDRLTWLAYLALGYYAYLLNGLGPATPFLRNDLGLSYTLSSLHFSAFAAGILVAGASSSAITRAIGRRRTFWLGAWGMAAGTLLLLIGRHPAVTIAGALSMGTLGSLLLVTIPAALADHHGQHRPIAITEANVVASLVSSLAPAAIGFFAAAGPGWRTALLLPLGAVLALTALFRGEPMPNALPAADADAPRGGLPRGYWLLWSVLTLSVAAEFCMVFWSAAFLEAEVGLPRSGAALATSVFLGGLVVGRLAGSRLVRRIASRRLVLGALGVSLGGFLLFWLGGAPLPAVVGLALTGLGIANLYPLVLSLAVGAAPGQTDLASARASLASGVAILALPLLLGGLADLLSLRAAYGIVPLLLALAALLLSAGRR